MKRVLVFFLAASLCACAGTSTKESSKSLSEAKVNNGGDDKAYMRRVEDQAAQRGVIVLWFHPPKAPKPKKDG